nr:endopeptidase La [Acidobacteriota bacterium]
VQATFEAYVKLNKRIPPEMLVSVASIDDPARLADTIVAHLSLKLNDKQSILEEPSAAKRLEKLYELMQGEIEILQVEKKIRTRVKKQMEKTQKEYYLNEQMKAIQKELGEDDQAGDMDELRDKLVKLELPAEVRKEVDRELGRLKRMGREAMEAQVIRTYLETIAELPWTARSEEALNIPEAARILEEDHYALGDVKDRVLEFLAVRQLRDEEASRRRAEAEIEAEAEAAELADAPPVTGVATATDSVLGGTGDDFFPTAPESAAATAKPGSTGKPPARPGTENGAEKGSKHPILLFVGPPGVGKTSVAKSIARAMGRKYIRVSLGGVRDEADIRGHRRTYVGAMPGRIIQGMKQAGSKNPVFLLDEVDKLGVSFQGDPASALLEVLDPAQNDTFTDHYLGVSFDLSEVLFIATANFIQNIPGPLLDRMEVVQFSGYTEREKLTIARRYLVPRQLTDNGVKADQLTISDEAISEVVTGYTREAGVRQLERELGRLARKVARKLAAREIVRTELGAPSVRDLLGRPKVHPERAAGQDQVGVATGMYYTPTGGDIMFVETSTMRGKGELVLTGQLGDVMKESARAAWSYARSHALSLGIKDECFDRDLHVHVPAGAIPKDGPSAGVTMATSLVSALSNRPARHDIAMTGEITLSGRVLPIGGVKEKVLGAVRAGIHKILVPKDNEADLEDLPKEVRDNLEVFLAQELGEVLALTLRGASFREGRLRFGDDLPEVPPEVPFSVGLH